MDLLRVKSIKSILKITSYNLKLPSIYHRFIDSLNLFLFPQLFKIYDQGSLSYWYGKYNTWSLSTKKQLPTLILDAELSPSAEQTLQQEPWFVSSSWNT